MDKEFSFEELLNSNPKYRIADNYSSVIILMAEKRKALGISKRDLAKKVNLKAKNITSYELGEEVPSFDVVVSLCYYLGLKIELKEK